MPKNENYISWENYFMELAKLSALRSKDPNTQVGACLVDSDNKIVAIGYNGLPKGMNDDEFSWKSPEKYSYVVHAEANALVNANDFKSIRGSRLYVTRFPCNECAKLLVQLGVGEVIYLDDKYHDEDFMCISRDILTQGRVKFKSYLSA